MFLSLPLALFFIAPPTQAGPVEAFLGEGTLAAARIDLDSLDVPASIRKLLGSLADEDDVAQGAEAVGQWVDSLKKAGVKEFHLLIDLADMPGPPVAVVPLAPGADGQAIAQLLTSGIPNTPIRWPATASKPGVVLAAAPAALARIAETIPTPRPDLTSALAALPAAPIRIALSPSDVQRRAFEESIGELPPELGGGPITAITRGMNWASIAMVLDPDRSLKIVIQAADANGATALQATIQKALELVAGAAKSDPAAAGFAEALARIQPRAAGDQIHLDADLEKMTALVAVPVRQALEAAGRARCTNNLKQIALAMHNYHDTHKHFPAAYTTDKAGKPLLSWRVHILPFLEQKSLYDEFHLDEPWDSAHNRALIPRMPAVYACARTDKTLTKQGKTNYVTLRGAKTLFPGDRPVKIEENTDGTSNTIMVVDAADPAAVVWTKPDDFTMTDAVDLAILLGHHPGGTNVGFADGSVRYIKQDIKPKLLENLSTRDGGEVISAEDY